MLNCNSTLDMARAHCSSSIPHIRRQTLRTETSPFFHPISERTQYTWHLRLHSRQRLDLQVSRSNLIVLRVLRTLIPRDIRLLILRPTSPTILSFCHWKHGACFLSFQSNRKCSSQDLEPRRANDLRTPQQNGAINAEQSLGDPSGETPLSVLGRSAIVRPISVFPTC